MRILRSTVMVRVGGGWVALDEFLVKNDPCRGRFVNISPCFVTYLSVLVQCEVTGLYRTDISAVYVLEDLSLLCVQTS